MQRQLDFLDSNAPRLNIPGLTYVPEFISAGQEQELVERIERGEWSHEFARRRQHYGLDYSGGSAEKKPQPMPEWIEKIGRMIFEAGLFDRMPGHALVNEYEPGQGISAHLDYRPFDQVASLSLLSGCIMEFERVKDHERREQWLEPRSLIVLVAEARHQWTHGIRPRLKDVVNGVAVPRQRRLSLTFRTVK